jgi:hypothetical protein
VANTLPCREETVLLCIALAFLPAGGVCVQDLLAHQRMLRLTHGLPSRVGDSLVWHQGIISGQQHGQRQTPVCQTAAAAVAQE